jgi:hypothetical protein
VFAEDNHLTIKELSRLALTDEMPKNSESQFIRRLFTEQRREGTDVLLSYADPTYGHTGIIYRATNWLYYGMSTGHTDSRGSFVVDGKLVGRSSLRKLAKSAIDREAALREIYGDKVTDKMPTVQKHVYLYALNRRARPLVAAFVRARKD